MAVTIIETWNSREANVSAQGGGETLRFFATGTTDEAELYVALIELPVPTTWNGFVRNDIRMTPKGGPHWDVEVVYAPTGAGGGDQPVGGDGTGGGVGGNPSGNPSGPAGEDDPLLGGYSFDTTGGTTHITQSLNDVSVSVPAGAAVPNHKKAIGKTADRIEGVDIFTPKLEFSRTVNRETVTKRYLKRLRGLTGTVNNDAFMEYLAGELLYLGATGQFTQGQGWSVTHRFAMSPNISDDIEVSDDITIPADPGVNEGYSKKGWQYLWVEYGNEVQGNRIAPGPISASVVDVYDDANFDLLEIT